jgi:hypothetical protein
MANYDIRRTIVADVLRCDWLQQMLALVFLGYCTACASYVIPCADWFPEDFFGIHFWVWFRTMLWSVMVVGLLAVSMSTICAIASNNFDGVAFVRGRIEKLLEFYTGSSLSMFVVAVTSRYTDSNTACLVVWSTLMVVVGYLPFKAKMCLSVPASIYVQYYWGLVTWSSFIAMVASNYGVDGFLEWSDMIVDQTRSMCRSILRRLELRVLHPVRDIREDPAETITASNQSRSQRAMMFGLSGVVMLVLVALPACMAYFVASAPFLSLGPTIQDVNPTQLMDMDASITDEPVIALWFLRDDQENKAFLREYAKFAADMKALIKPLAINCDKWESFCKEQRVQLTPVVKMHVPGTKLTTTLPYHRNRNAASLVSKVRKLFPDSAVHRLDSKWSIDNFFAVGKSKMKVVLYTKKTSLPFTIKVLASVPSFQHNVQFGFATDRSPSIIKGLKVQQFPTLIGLNDRTEHTVYDGDVNFAAIRRWVSGLLADSRQRTTSGQEAL